MRKALIIGISGQDGSYLAKFLLEKGYEVHGTSRNAELSTFNGLKRLGIFEWVNLYSMSLIDFESVMQTLLRIQPNEIYNLAGQTSVGLSFDQPLETLKSICIGTLNILEIMRSYKLEARFYNAASSECFGETGGLKANEHTVFKPRSPYAVAKAASFWQVANYREAYNLFACSGILFNHESPLRSNRFVTKKIIHSAIEIFNKRQFELVLGNVKITRDWGWAPEYAEAMYLILQQEKPEDFVIASGQQTTLEEFVSKTFRYFNLNYKNFLRVDEGLYRPTDILYSCGDASKAKINLGWKAHFGVDNIIKMMIEDELNCNS